MKGIIQIEEQLDKFRVVKELLSGLFIIISWGSFLYLSGLTRIVLVISLLFIALLISKETVIDFLRKLMLLSIVSIGLILFVAFFIFKVPELFGIQLTSEIIIAYIAIASIIISALNLSYSKKFFEFSRVPTLCCYLDSFLELKIKNYSEGLIAKNIELEIIKLEISNTLFKKFKNIFLRRVPFFEKNYLIKSLGDLEPKGAEDTKEIDIISLLNKRNIEISAVKEFSEYNERITKINRNEEFELQIAVSYRTDNNFIIPNHIIKKYIVKLKKNEN